MQSNRLDIYLLIKNNELQKIQSLLEVLPQDECLSFINTVKEISGRSPLLYAISLNHIAIAKLLIKHGAEMAECTLELRKSAIDYVYDINDGELFDSVFDHTKAYCLKQIKSFETFQTLDTDQQAKILFIIIRLAEYCINYEDEDLEAEYFDVKNIENENKVVSKVVEEDNEDEEESNRFHERLMAELKKFIDVFFKTNKNIIETRTVYWALFKYYFIWAEYGRAIDFLKMTIIAYQKSHQVLTAVSDDNPKKKSLVINNLSFEVEMYYDTLCEFAQQEEMFSPLISTSITQTVGNMMIAVLKMEPISIASVFKRILTYLNENDYLLTYDAAFQIIDNCEKVKPLVSVPPEEIANVHGTLAEYFAKLAITMIKVGELEKSIYLFNLANSHIDQYESDKHVLPAPKNLTVLKKLNLSYLGKLSKFESLKRALIANAINDHKLDPKTFIQIIRQHLSTLKEFPKINNLTVDNVYVLILDYVTFQNVNEYRLMYIDKIPMNDKFPAHKLKEAVENFDILLSACKVFNTEKNLQSLRTVLFNMISSLIRMKPPKTMDKKMYSESILSLLTTFIDCDYHYHKQFFHKTNPNNLFSSVFEILNSYLAIGKITASGELPEDYAEKIERIFDLYQHCCHLVANQFKYMAFTLDFGTLTILGFLYAYHKQYDNLINLWSRENFQRAKILVNEEHFQPTCMIDYIYFLSIITNQQLFEKYDDSSAHVLDNLMQSMLYLNELMTTKNTLKNINRNYLFHVCYFWKEQAKKFESNGYPEHAINYIIFLYNHLLPLMIKTEHYKTIAQNCLQLITEYLESLLMQLDTQTIENKAKLDLVLERLTNGIDFLLAHDQQHLFKNIVAKINKQTVCLHRLKLSAEISSLLLNRIKNYKDQFSPILTSQCIQLCYKLLAINDGQQSTSLLQACLNGHVRDIERFVAEGESLIVNPETQENYLHLLCQQQEEPNLDSILTLLKLRHNLVAQVDHKQQTPLHYLIEAKHFYILESILTLKSLTVSAQTEIKQSLHTKNGNGLTPLNLIKYQQTLSKLYQAIPFKYINLFERESEKALTTTTSPTVFLPTPGQSSSPEKQKSKRAPSKNEKSNSPQKQKAKSFSAKSESPKLHQSTFLKPKARTVWERKKAVWANAIHNVTVNSNEDILFIPLQTWGIQEKSFHEYHAFLRNILNCLLEQKAKSSAYPDFKGLNGLEDLPDTVDMNSPTTSTQYTPSKYDGFYVVGSEALAALLLDEVNLQSSDLDYAVVGPITLGEFHNALLQYRSLLRKDIVALSTQVKKLEEEKRFYEMEINALQYIKNIIEANPNKLVEYQTKLNTAKIQLAQFEEQKKKILGVIEINKKTPESNYLNSQLRILKNEIGVRRDIISTYEKYLKVDETLLGLQIAYKDLCEKYAPLNKKLLHKNNCFERYGKFNVRRQGTKIQTLLLEFLNIDGQAIPSIDISFVKSQDFVANLYGRDFGVNGCYIRSDCIVADKAALNDLSSGIIRCFGNAKERIHQQFVLKLRALRQFLKLQDANFKFDNTLEQALIDPESSFIKKVSNGDLGQLLKLHKQLTKLIKLADIQDLLVYLKNYGLLSQIEINVSDIPSVFLHIINIQPTDDVWTQQFKQSLTPYIETLKTLKYDVSEWLQHQDTITLVTKTLSADAKDAEWQAGATLVACLLMAGVDLVPFCQQMQTKEMGYEVIKYS